MSSNRFLKADLQPGDTGTSYTRSVYKRKHEDEGRTLAQHLAANATSPLSFQEILPTAWKSKSSDTTFWLIRITNDTGMVKQIRGFFEGTARVQAITALVRAIDDKIQNE
jgi:hypothetical protein